MKFLILLVCLGYVAADLQRRAAPLVDDAVLAFKEGMAKAGSLRQALGMPEAIELDEVEEDLKEELAKKIKEKFKNLLEKIKDNLQEKKEIVQALWDKLKELRQKLKDLREDVGGDSKELLHRIVELLKDKLKDFFKKHLEKSDKRNLDEEYDAVARSKFRDMIEKIKAEILSNETIRKIREYIKNFVTNNPAIKAFKEFILKLKDTDFRQLIRDLFEHRRESRDLKDLWEKVKDYFKDMKESLWEKTAKFREWMKNVVGKGIEKLKEKRDIIIELCKEAISHAKDLHGEVAKEALEFFRPYKEDLGNLWKELLEAIKDRIVSF